MTPEVVLFAVFSVMCVVSALGVVVIRNPIKGAMSLIASFFCLACLFLLQSAELVAVLEILVYAGAIMVLFVFVIMLVEDHEQPIVRAEFGSRIMLSVKVLAVGVVAFAIIHSIGKAEFGPSGELPDGFGSAKAVGREFFDNFIFHFEMTSLLLLVGIVGAVIVSKRRRNKVL